jgi:hypothetical protein
VKARQAWKFLAVMMCSNKKSRLSAAGAVCE